MSWTVPYIDYPQQFRRHENQILGLIRDVLSRGDVMLRQQLRDFETHLAEFCGVRRAVGVSNCTDGLRLVLHALGIGPGDEVITVSHTFVATVSAIHHVGAKPVLVDIGDDHLMDMGCVEAAITPRTKAIVPVHLNGRICDMERLDRLAQRCGMVVIEDAAQALGATFNGTRAGAFGVAAAFSFYPAKLLGCYGDGGAVVTNNPGLADRLTRLRDHGRDGKEITEWSFNCRLDNLQAAILDYKLRLFPREIERRRELAHRYQTQLRGVKGLYLPPPPQVGEPQFDVFQNYEIESADVDGLERHLNQRGIEVMRPWGGKGVHQFNALGLNNVSLPRTEQLFGRALMLPMHTELADEQVDYVTAAVREFHAGWRARSAA